MKQWKEAYELSISECISLGKQQVEKEKKRFVIVHTSGQNHKHYEAVESNLHSDHK